MVNAQSGLGVALMNPANLLASDDAPAAMKRAGAATRGDDRRPGEERLRRRRRRGHTAHEGSGRAAGTSAVPRELLGDAPVPVCGLTATETREGDGRRGPVAPAEGGLGVSPRAADRRELRYSVVDLSERQGSRGELPAGRRGRGL